MKTTLLLIVVLGLAAFAQAGKNKRTGKNNAPEAELRTKELHGHEHDEEHPDSVTLGKAVNFGGTDCVCFFKKRGYCVDHRTYVTKNRDMEAAEKEAADKETDEYKEKEKERIG